MANFPQELVQDAVCQGHTSYMNGLWFLPSPAFKAEYWWMNEWQYNISFQSTKLYIEAILMKITTRRLDTQKLWGVSSSKCVNLYSETKENYNLTGVIPTKSRIQSVTGISGSIPDMDQRFRFKLWRSSWTQIPLAANDLTGDKAGGVRAVKAFKSLSLDRTSIKCQVVGILRLGFSEWNPRLLSLWGHNWFSRSACERPLKMFI